MRRTKAGWSCRQPAAQAAKFPRKSAITYAEKHARDKRQTAVQELAGFLSLASSRSPRFR